MSVNLATWEASPSTKHPGGRGAWRCLCPLTGGQLGVTTQEITVTESSTVELHRPQGTSLWLETLSGTWIKGEVCRGRKEPSRINVVSRWSRRPQDIFKSTRGAHHSHRLMKGSHMIPPAGAGKCRNCSHITGRSQKHPIEREKHGAGEGTWQGPGCGRSAVPRLSMPC